MKYCLRCKNECNDDARFCVKCGKPFNPDEPVLRKKKVPVQPEAVAEPVQPVAEKAPQAAVPEGDPQAEAQGAPQVPTYQPPPRYIPPQMNNGEEPVSVGKWILYRLIQLVPIAYLIMLFVWAFGNAENTTFRNWARAELILYGILVVLCIIIIVLAVVFAVGAGSMMSDYDYSAFIHF